MTQIHQRRTYKAKNRKLISKFWIDGKHLQNSLTDSCSGDELLLLSGVLIDSININIDNDSKAVFTSRIKYFM